MKAGNLKKLWISQQLNGSNDAPSTYALKDLQQTIDPSNHLPHRSLCKCQLCLAGTRKNDYNQDLNYLQRTTLLAKRLFKRILQGLTMSGAKSLKLFIPDIFFVQGDCLEIYQTAKDSRVTKLSGSTPLKHTYATMLRMRKQYKSNLEHLFNKKMLDQVDPERMHAKYYDICVPSHFHPGITNPFTQGNKNQFKRYVLHNDKRYEIQGLQEHKMNERQPFCIVVYKDGNSQLLNQVQLQFFTLQAQSRIEDEILYFQSYIKYKKQTDSILYSEYKYSPQTIDLELDNKTQIQVMITLGGLGKYDEGYNDLENLQQISIQIMLNEPKRYVDLMTYKIIHYLAMASRLYLTYLKIKWIVNDAGTIYIQEIMECKVSEIPRRIIRYKMPKKDENIDFYSKKGHFLDMYKDLKKRRALNTLIIKKDIDNKTYEQLLTFMNPQMKQEYDERKLKQQAQRNQSTKLSALKKKGRYESRLYNTLDVVNQQSPKIRIAKRLKMSNASTYQEHIKQHPQLVMKNMRYDSVSLSRYQPQRAEKVDHKINSHFLFHMSTEDKKILSSFNNKHREDRQTQSSLDKYIQKRKDKVERSLLYSTFHDLNRQKMEKMNELFEQERIGQKLLQSSSRHIAISNLNTLQ